MRSHHVGWNIFAHHTSALRIIWPSSSNGSPCQLIKAFNCQFSVLLRLFVMLCPRKLRQIPTRSPTTQYRPIGDHSAGNACHCASGTVSARLPLYASNRKFSGELHTLRNHNHRTRWCNRSPAAFCWHTLHRGWWSSRKQYSGRQRHVWVSHGSILKASFPS